MLVSKIGIVVSENNDHFSWPKVLLQELELEVGFTHVKK